MDLLDEFFDSEENQKKYGFEYHKKGSRSSSIIFQGDIDELMNIAYKALGFVEIKEKTEINDPRPVLNIQVNQDGRLVIKDTEIFIETDVDGVGDEPNFYICFSEGNNTITIRFNMLKPELYPDNWSSSYILPNSSLSVINKFFGRNFPLFIKSGTI